MRAEIRENATTHGAWCVIHPLSPEDSAAMTALRSAVAGMKGKLEGTARLAVRSTASERASSPLAASPLRSTRSEAYLAGGLDRRRLADARSRDGVSL